MKRTWKALAAMMLIVTAIIVAGCNKPDEHSGGNSNGQNDTIVDPNNGGGNNDSDVRVTTYTPQDITATTAVCGGDVIAVQGLSLSGIGVCWSTEDNPTIDDSHVFSEQWNEPFVCIIEDLEPETQYYVRAVALRGLMCYYGEIKSFTTLENNNGNDTIVEISFVGTWGVEKVEYYNVDYAGNPISASLYSIEYDPASIDNGIQLIFRENQTGEMRNSAIDTLWTDYNEETGMYETVIPCPDTVLITPFSCSYNAADTILYMNMEDGHVFSLAIKSFTNNSFIYENEYSLNYIEKAYLKRIADMQTIADPAHLHFLVSKRGEKVKKGLLGN